MSTTPPDEGATPVAQPVPDEAVTSQGDMVITTDEAGTPTMVPAETAEPQTETPSQETETEEPAAETEQKAEEAQADTDEEVIAWAEKKGIKIDPSNPEMVKLARVNLENDRRFHENQTKKVPVPELLPESDDVAYNALVEKQNTIELKTYVRDWFDANPDMKAHRAELQRIANERPYLTDMDDIRAHFLANPSREAQLRQEGGKKALQNLAQKQSAIPPASAATNSGFATGKLTAQNIDARVKAMSPEEYKAALPEINAVLEGRA